MNAQTARQTLHQITDQHLIAKELAIGAGRRKLATPIIEDDSGLMLAMMTLKDQYKESTRICRLFAAAPEMAAALEIVINWAAWDEEAEGGSKDAFRKTFVPVLRAALEKAENGSS